VLTPRGNVSEGGPTKSSGCCAAGSLRQSMSLCSSAQVVYIECRSTVQQRLPRVCLRQHPAVALCRVVRQSGPCGALSFPVLKKPLSANSSQVVGHSDRFDGFADADGELERHARPEKRVLGVLVKDSVI